VLRLVKCAVSSLLRPVHALRQQIGLPPTRLNPLFEGQFSSVGAIGLYSTLLGAIRADYPQPTSIAGFAWFDSADGASRAALFVLDRIESVQHKNGDFR
jgi:rhamnosyltransferase subunit B